jgi:hypothetical protein
MVGEVRNDCIWKDFNYILGCTILKRFIGLENVRLLNKTLTYRVTGYAVAITSLTYSSDFHTSAASQVTCVCDASHSKAFFAYGTNGLWKL